jgi:ferredoxin
MRVIADRTKCVGAGRCVSTAPELFDQRDEDGLVTLLIEYPPDHLRDAAREAADLCPSLAITIEE